MLSHKQLVATYLLSSLLIFSTFAESSIHYKVTHVAGNDSLNIRADAGVSNTVIAAIPFNGSGIQAMGEERAVGKTIWMKVKWQDKEGWVSKHYLQAEQVSAEEPIVVTKASVIPVKSKPDVAKKVLPEIKPVKVIQESPVVSNVETEKNIETLLVENNIITENDTKKVKQASETAVVEHVTPEKSKKAKEEVGKWILQCGDKKPYWKVELHPKSLEIYRDKYTTSLPITLKKQHKNKWNTALKTVVKGKEGSDNLEMTIKYAYSKRCYDTLSSLVVPYKVTTIFNGETLTGCCHAVQLKEETRERQISKAP
ncbi:MAG TPA: SH3 domain-containing protein [Thiothrix sp.]|nr:SH3 domain-containing protein [Thiothrix sp.]